MQYAVRMTTERREHKGTDYKVIGTSAITIPAFDRRDAEGMADTMNRGPCEFTHDPRYSEARSFEPVAIIYQRTGKLVLSFGQIQDLCEEWTKPDSKSTGKPSFADDEAA